MPFFGGSGQYVIVGTNIKGGNDAAPSIIGINNMALGNGALEANFNANRAIAIGADAASVNTDASDSVVIGANSYDGTRGNKSVIIGSIACTNMGANASITDSVIIGYNAHIDNAGISDETIVIGKNAFATGSEALVIGANSYADPGCIIVGNSGNADDTNALVIGNNSNSAHDNVIVIGNHKTSSAPDQINIGDVSHTSIIIGGQDFSGGPGGASTWGDISGTLSNQTDLQNALDASSETALWGGISGDLSDQTDLQAALYLKLDVTAAREKLTANRTYYVSTTGSDSNDGLTVGAPFLTVQKAVDTACALDLSIYSVSIQNGDGTFNGAIVLKPYLGAGPITIIGNTGNSSAVVLNHSATTVGANSFSGRWDVKYVKITAGGNGVLSNLGCKIFIDNVVLGACGGYHLAAVQGAIVVSGNYTINGAAAAHWYASSGGSITCANKTLTISGTPAFTYFAQSTNLASMTVNGNTYSGSATGTRYIANLNAVIDSGATTLPGNVAGSTATGGQYA